MKFIPNYDKDFYPMSVRLQEFRAEVKNSKSKKLSVCVERNNGYNYIYTIDIFDDSIKAEQNYFIVERIIKSILWVVGGYKIYICGDKKVFDKAITYDEFIELDV